MNSQSKENDGVQARNKALTNTIDVQARNKALTNTIDVQARNKAVTNTIDVQARNKAVTNTIDVQARNKALTNTIDVQARNKAVTNTIDVQARNKALTNTIDVQARNKALTNTIDVQARNKAVTNTIDVQARNKALTNTIDVQSRNKALTNTIDVQSRNNQSRNKALTNTIDVQSRNNQSRNKALTNTIDVQSRNKALTNTVDELILKGQSFDVSQRFYTQWAIDGSYDEMCSSNKERYAGPHVSTDTLARLVKNREQALVLDLGSGTGLIAQKLVEKGFKNFHGLDPNKEFNETAKRKGLYQKLMEQVIGNGIQVDADNDTYDAVVTSSTFCPGHIPCDALHEIIRVLKPGGYFVNCMREEFLTNTPEYKDRLEPLIKKLEQEGKWRLVAWEKYPNHYNDCGGLLMIFQVC